MSKTPAAGILRIPCRGCSHRHISKIVSLFRTLALFQILLGGGEHELDSVELVDFAGTGIVVDGHNVCVRILVADFLNDTLAYDMVRKACKRLCADAVLHA